MSETKENLRTTYNRYAEQRNEAKMEPWKFKERQLFLQAILEEDKNVILELGAGTGRDGHYFKENRFDVVCVDLSDEHVRLCREKGLDARVMDFYELAFEPEIFDAVYAMNSLLHVPKADLGTVLEQVHRVLKPGGLFFFGVYGGKNSDAVWEGDRFEPKRHFTMYEDDDLLAIVRERFGVEEFHVEPLGEGVPHFQSLLLRK
ncbi:class I SAM-dependent methyltransferase [Cohnella suwonensis]|uniref:Class I SAM-dependent methyltransferase n=1 Tax=Cohnella suwonensis TaxID=696072 RepID=A0ABW0LQX1_9BACL